jgi:hypothetical protein
MLGVVVSNFRLVPVATENCIGAKSEILNSRLAGLQSLTVDEDQVKLKLRKG